MQITIDLEFKNLIPPLTDEEYHGLEESILSEGCRDALTLWGNTLVDGHNRYEICTRYGIPFNTVQMDFQTRDDVIVWIIKNQFGRRNLPAYERARLALRLKPVIAEKAKERQNLGLKSDEGGRTDVALAKVAGLGHDTIAKVEKIEAQATPEVKEQLRTGAMSINQAYTEVKRQEKAEQRAERIAAIKEKAAVFDGDIVNGDCVAELERLENGSIDCVVTDPPYGIDYVSNRRMVESEVIKPVANDGLKDALTLWENACEVLSRKMKDNSHIYIFTSWKVYPQFAEITARYFRIKNCLIWLKNNHGTGDLEGNYSEQYEMVIFATKGNRKLNGGRDSNILEFDKVSSENLLHSCEKPVDLLGYLIEKSSDAGELIADPFAGSGSTLIAAKNKGRKYWGCELDADNYRIACGRCAQA